jgi:glycosyltransferase involved in cell wall biosynthesis
LPADRVLTVLGAADPHLFKGHQRGDGAVGFVSAYYPRKSPETLIGIVRALRDTQFMLVGRGWKASPVSATLARLDNLEIFERPYADYPELYQLMDVFVSPSSLEGGPIPLLEAMMSNVYPVATRTGFAPDVINDGVNGLLCDVGSSAQELAELVARAGDSDAEIRSSVLRLDWPRFARCIHEALGGAS